MAINPHLLDPATIFVASPLAAGSWLIIAPLALCLGAGALLVMLRGFVRLQPVIAGVALAVLLLLDLALLAHVWSLGPQTMVMGRWLPPFGIAFTVDMTGALLNLVGAFIAFCVFIQSLGEIDANQRRHGFYPLLMMLMAGTTGAFLTGDIFNLYVWFEVLLISSFGLLVLGGEKGQLDGAIKYGVLNLIATTLFLVATGYAYAIFGTLNMADLARKIAAGAPEGSPMLALAALYALAFGMKAAAFPVNFWLPAAYHTPSSPVSALFSGLLTKVGIYALLRVLVMILPTERQMMADVLSAVAILTMVLASLQALGLQDIRRIANHLVIAGIGLMLAGVAMGTPKALQATLFYAVHSMAAMAALFMVTGLVGKAGRSLALSRLGGLWTASPALSAIIMVLALAIAGLPPASGFWPKAMLVKEALATGRPWLAGAILLSAFLVTLVLGRVILFAVWRPAEGDGPLMPRRREMVPALMAIVPLVMLGLWPAPLLELAGLAASGLGNPAAYLASVFPGGAP